LLIVHHPILHLPSSSSSYSTTASEKNKYKNVIQKIEDRIKELENPKFDIRKNGAIGIRG
jgi:hypothetical protein